MRSVSATVLIDTYNHGAFLDEAIQSVLNQDYPSDQTEVLVVDDGSTDETFERVKKYGQKIRYIRKPNGGQASAFNVGLANSHGDVVLLLDGDDAFLPGKIGRVAAEFRKNPRLGMVYHPYLEVDMRTNEHREGKFNAISGSIWEDEEAFFWYVPAGTCASYRRGMLEELLPVPEGLRTQADGYLSSLIVYVAQILAIPECLSTYRFHDNNFFYHPEEVQMPVEFRMSRNGIRQIQIGAIQEWLRAHGYASESRKLRSFLGRLMLYQENERFMVEPPGRAEFFRHLLLYNRCYGPHISRRLRVLNYLNAAGALFTGYKHFHILEGSRKRAFSLVRQIAGREGDAR